MYGWRGILTGALALIVLQAVVAGAGADHVGVLFDFANELASRFIDPKVPAIPARSQAPLAPPEGTRSFGPPVVSSPTGSGGGFSEGAGGGGGGGGGGGVALPLPTPSPTPAPNGVGGIFI